MSSSGETGGFRSDGTASFGCIVDLASYSTVFQQYQMSMDVIAMRKYKTRVYASIADLIFAINSGSKSFALLVCVLSYLYIRNSTII